MFISGQSSGFYPRKHRENAVNTKENRGGTVAAWHTVEAETQRFGRT
jgi:hypothetical protein